MVQSSISCSSAVRMKRESHEYKFDFDYSKVRDLAINMCIVSPTFECGGHDWAIHYYPHYKAKNDQFICLVLLSKAEDVSVEFCFFLSNKSETSCVCLWDSSYTFNGDMKEYGKRVNRSVQFYTEDGIFTISCKIVALSEKRNKVFPTSDGLQEHIGKLLERQENFDVTFEVEGNKISAHRLIMAARSPVFKTELFGSMAENDMACIKIEDMKPDVFKAMICFMYTDMVPGIESFQSSNMSVEFLQDLFVAADRYALENLKKLCQEALCNNLSVEMISTTLLLADRHSCPLLKERCLEYASQPENFMRLALTKEYVHMIEAAPSLLIELREKVNCFLGTGNKKRKIESIVRDSDIETEFVPIADVDGWFHWYPYEI